MSKEDSLPNSLSSPQVVHPDNLLETFKVSREQEQAPESDPKRSPLPFIITIFLLLSFALGIAFYFIYLDRLSDTQDEQLRFESMLDN